MAVYDVSYLPLGSTRTLSSDIDQLTIRKTYISPSNFSKSISITNLDGTNELYISFSATATPTDEELTVLPGNTVNIDTSRHGAFDIRIRGTSGSKYSYLLI